MPTQGSFNFDANGKPVTEWLDVEPTPLTTRKQAAMFLDRTDLWIAGKTKKGGWKCQPGKKSGFGNMAFASFPSEKQEKPR